MTNLTVQGVYYSNGSEFYRTGVLSSVDDSYETVRLSPFSVAYTAEDYIYIRKSDGSTLVPVDRDFELDVKYFVSAITFTEPDGTYRYVYPNLDNVSVSVVCYENDGTAHTLSNQNLSLKKFSGSYYTLHTAFGALDFEISSFRIRISYGRYDSGFDLTSVSFPVSSVERHVGFTENKPLVSIQTEEASFLKKTWKSILDLPNKLKEMLTDFFLPDEDSIISIRDRLDEILSDHFGCVYQVVGLFDDLTDALLETSADKDTVELPAVTIPLPGSNFTFGPYVVPLIPDRFDGIVNTLKSFIGIMCTLAFLNMLKNRYEEVITK